MYEVCPKCNEKTKELDGLQTLAAMIEGRKIVLKVMVRGCAEEEVMVAVKICGRCEVTRRDQLRLQRKQHEAEIRRSRIYKRAAAAFRVHRTKRVNYHGR